ncbi:MAG: hypothetical protein IPN78_19230 [Candidatus Accumulibacter sp.]|nr:hypothetical protein [Candidatus Accumulibacter propinquus]
MVVVGDQRAAGHDPVQHPDPGCRLQLPLAFGLGAIHFPLARASGVFPCSSRKARRLTREPNRKIGNGLLSCLTDAIDTGAAGAIVDTQLRFW